MDFPIALQLWSVRDKTEKDFESTLIEISKIGYDAVEFAGFGDIEATEMKRILDDNGLKVAGSHTAKDLLIDKLDEVIEYNKIIGNKYIICPYDKFETLDEIRKAADQYNEIGEILSNNDMVFCYHNHSHELKKIDGKYMLDILYDLTDPKYLKTEVDTYWVAHIGIDPIEYVKRYKGRAPLVHLKDMNADDKEMTEIGTGSIDMKNLVKTSIEMGVKTLVIEQDESKNDSLVSAKISYDNLLEILNTGGQ